MFHPYGISSFFADPSLCIFFTPPTYFWGISLSLSLLFSGTPSPMFYFRCIPFPHIFNLGFHFAPSGFQNNGIALRWIFFLILDNTSLLLMHTSEERIWTSRSLIQLNRSELHFIIFHTSCPLNEV